MTLRPMAKVNPATEMLADSEVQWHHLQFTRSHYGILLNSFNDLDNFFHGCLFSDNQFGIASAHGNFYVYDTRFERSNISDVFNGGSACTGCSLWRTVSVNSSMFSLNGGWCGLGVPTKLHDCRIHGYGAMTGATAIAATLGLPAATVPAVAQVWRGPLLLVDTQFTPATDIGQPAIASWNASFSRRFLDAAQFILAQPGIYNETWSRTYLFSNTVLHGSGPLLQSMEHDNSHNLSAGRIPPSVITEHTTFIPATRYHIRDTRYLTG